MQQNKGKVCAAEPHREHVFSDLLLNASLIRGCENEIATGKTVPGAEKQRFSSRNPLSPPLRRRLPNGRGRA
jgi:hypothetical protein